MTQYKMENTNKYLLIDLAKFGTPEGSLVVIEEKDLNLRRMYDLLKGVTSGVDCITIPSFTIDGEMFDVIADDNGLFNPSINQTINRGMFKTDQQIIVGHKFEDLSCGHEFLAGNLIFSKNDDEGETIGLTDAEIEKIKQFFRKNAKFTAFFMG